MKTIEKTVKVSPETFQVLKSIKEETGIPIKRIITNFALSYVANKKKK